jgi:hypothetical protein
MENHSGIISAGKTPDSSTRALWQSYQQSQLVSKQEELDERNDEFGLTKYVCLYFEGILNMLFILTTWG